MPTLTNDVPLTSDAVCSLDGRSEKCSASVREALANSNVAGLRILRVDTSQEEICLSGRVRSFYHKQLAQELIRPVAAGRQVVNRVDVS